MSEQRKLFLEQHPAHRANPKAAKFEERVRAPLEAFRQTCDEKKDTTKGMPVQLSG